MIRIKVSDLNEMNTWKRTLGMLPKPMHSELMGKN